VGVPTPTDGHGSRAVVATLGDRFDVRSVERGVGTTIGVTTGDALYDPMDARRARRLGTPGDR